MKSLAGEYRFVFSIVHWHLRMRTTKSEINIYPTQKNKPSVCFLSNTVVFFLLKIIFISASLFSNLKGKLLAKSF